MGPGVVFKTGSNGVCENGVKTEDRMDSKKMKEKTVKMIATDVEKLFKVGRNVEIHN